MSFSRFLGATALLTTLIPATAFAQMTPTATPEGASGATSQDATAPAPEQDATAAADATDVVVTGSRIRRPNDDSPLPITTVTSQEIIQSGRISVGDVLNDLPQLKTSLGSQNSTSGLGTRGVNFLDLRGLERARTLVLVNGRRHVSADIINSGNAVDINSLPTDLIDRIDIVTGGNSSIYGSDAIAGVVNFVLKTNFDGLEINARNGISKYGDAGNQYVSLVAGRNFANGRGNIALNLEFAHQQDYYASGRPNLRQNDGFVAVDTDVGASSDDVNDRVFFRDTRSATNALGGQLGFRYANTPTAPCGVDAVGSSFTCAFLFQPDGSLDRQTGLRVGLGPNGSFVGGNGYSGRERKILVLSPDVKRYVANALGHFEISPAFVPFFEAKYVRTESFGSQSNAFFATGQTLGDGIRIAGFNDRSYGSGTGTTAGLVNREGVRLDNPFLSAQARTAITTQLSAAINSGVNPNTGALFVPATATATQRANGLANQATALSQVAAGTYRFSLRRNYYELGTRDEEIRRETYRAVVGVRGDFAEDFNYELSANYGEHRERNVITGNVNAYQRFLLALDSTRNSAGQIVCRSQVDPRYAGTDAAGNPAQLATDVAACVPLNPFGEGNITDAAKSYLLLPTVATGKATQFVAGGFISGNLSKLFELPGGPIGFSLGGEYRRETLTYDLDDLTQAGYAFYNAIPSFNAPAFEVKEAFAELSIPLVKDVFLLKELTINGSARVADYKSGAGTVYAYSGDVTWRPVSDLLLRGSYSRSVRAPYLGELYSPAGQNFTPAPLDPCSTRNINTGTSTRTANCTAAGRPANYDFVYAQSLEIVSGGNPNLKAEKGTSFTLGGVFQPSVLRGLSLSVDYWDITVDDVITSPAIQTALNACYDAPNLNNQFCALFQRAGAGGGPNGEQEFQIIEASYQDFPLNYAKYKARGIDTNLAFSRDFGFMKATLRGVWTHTIQRDNYTDPSRPDYKNVINDELGNPSDQVNFSTDLKFGALTIGHSLRWIGGMYLNTFEDYNSVNGNPPENPDYAEIVRYPSVVFQDVRVAYDVNTKFNIYSGITNVTDKNPPFGLTGVGAGSGIYDNRGRFFYLGVTAKF